MEFDTTTTTTTTTPTSTKENNKKILKFTICILLLAFTIFLIGFGLYANTISNGEFHHNYQKFHYFSGLKAYPGCNAIAVGMYLLVMMLTLSSKAKTWMGKWSQIFLGFITCASMIAVAIVCFTSDSDYEYMELNRRTGGALLGIGILFPLS